MIKFKRCSFGRDKKPLSKIEKKNYDWKRWN